MNRNVDSFQAKTQKVKSSLGKKKATKSLYFSISVPNLIKEQEAAQQDGSLQRCGTLSTSEEGCRSASYGTTI